MNAQQYVPGSMYDEYWRFAAQRQAVYERRLEGQPPPGLIIQCYRMAIYQCVPGLGSRKSISHPKCHLLGKSTDRRRSVSYPTIQMVQPS